MGERLLSIGRFGRLCGLSIEALRHYDELGILRPASVDPETGYRRYAPGQLAAARAVARLRALDVPLGKVAAYLAAESPEAARRILERHHADVEARTARLAGIAHGLRQIISEREDLVTDTVKHPILDPDARRRLAVDLFNHVWTLLETPDRTVDQDDEMVHAAHASRFLWGQVGEAANRARGEWQCSRVYATLGRAEPALHHARRCLEICEANGIGDWDVAAAYEALARASRVAGDEAGRARYRAAGEEALVRIADPEDRQLIAADLAALD
jgi:DNA-binding transcriptional MerR regulator